MAIRNGLMASASAASLARPRPAPASASKETQEPAAAETTATTAPPAPAASSLPAPRYRAADKDDDDDGDDDDDDEKAESDDDKKKDDDDGDRADANDPRTRSARARERGKMAAIFNSPAGQAAFKANPDKVVRFMIGYSGTRQEAIATLELFGTAAPAAPAATTPPLRERMAESQVPNAGPGGDGGNPQMNDVAAMIVQADKIRRGEK
jgi:hypothetical protein